MSKNENAPASSSAAQQGTRAAAAGVASLEAMADQIAALQRQALERMKTSVQDAARLYGESLDYAAALSAHWRTFMVDTMRRATEVPAP